MNQPVNLPASIDLDNLSWMRLEGGPEFDYHIDYAYSVLKADVAAGHIEVLIKWEPNAYCHYHRHLGTTTATIVQGEQHLLEERPCETVTKVRTVGFSGPVKDGDVHMEHAGPEGMTILFDIHVPDGHLFDLLDRDGKVIAPVMLADLAERKFGVAA